MLAKYSHQIKRMPVFKIKKIVPLFITCVLISTLSFSQNTKSLPTLSKLMSWGDMSYQEFETEAKTFGFSFNQKHSKQNLTAYVYIRKIRIGNFDFTEKLTYRTSNSDNSPSIEFDAVQDLLTFYSSQYQSNKFVSIKCGIKPAETENAFCYSNNSYLLRVLNTNRQYKSGWGKEYTVIIYKFIR